MQLPGWIWGEMEGMVFSRTLDETFFLYTERTDITVPSVKGRKSSV